MHCIMPEYLTMKKKGGRSKHKGRRIERTKKRKRAGNLGCRIPRSMENYLIQDRIYIYEILISELSKVREKQIGGGG